MEFNLSEEIIERFLNAGFLFKSYEGQSGRFLSKNFDLGQLNWVAKRVSKDSCLELDYEDRFVVEICPDGSIQYCSTDCCNGELVYDNISRDRVEDWTALCRDVGVLLSPGELELEDNNESINDTELTELSLALDMANNNISNYQKIIDDCSSELEVKMLTDTPFVIEYGDFYLSEVEIINGKTTGKFGTTANPTEADRFSRENAESIVGATTGSAKEAGTTIQATGFRDACKNALEHCKEGIADLAPKVDELNKSHQALLEKEGGDKGLENSHQPGLN